MKEKKGEGKKGKKERKRKKKHNEKKGREKEREKESGVPKVGTRQTKKKSTYLRRGLRFKR